MRRLWLAGAALGLALVVAGGPSALAFEYHGYFRTGIGSNSEGGDQVCFQLPGAGSKYRLGNECETYGELQFSEDVFKSKDGALFKVHTMFGLKTLGAADFENLSSSPNEFALRQLWGEATGVFGKGVFKDARLWVGKRYYQRNDVHISDFFYWNDSGPGAGLENVNVGLGRLHYAIVRLRNNATSQILNNDLRVSDINVNPKGQLTVGFAYAVADEKGGTSKDGWAVNVQHLQGEFLGGFNKLALQYGKDGDVGSDGTGGSIGTPVITAAGLERKRVVEQLVWQPTPQFSGQFTTVFEDFDNDGDPAKSGKWFSIGARPIWHFAEYFNVAFEYGYDMVDPDQGGSTLTQHKFTLAPQVSAGRSFWSRPVFRLFVTHAVWNAAARDAALALGNSYGAFSDNRSGTSYGFQFETWF